MDRLADLGQHFGGRLIWLPEAGVGYFPVKDSSVYDQAYFDRYAELAETDLGVRLTAGRVQLLRRHVGDEALVHTPTLDVGIGAGTFIEAMRGCGYPCHGTDINPAAIDWLRQRLLRANLRSATQAHRVVTFWDSLEHLPNPSEALHHCRDWVFVAIPTFRDATHILSSRHYRHDEHYWYWTREGFVQYSRDQGFEVVDILATETAMGRDGIETFVLRRRP